MPQTIVITQANLVGSGNNTFEYNFPSTQTFKNASIAVCSASMYYSWFNISAAQNNNSFQYTIPYYNGVINTTITRTVTLPDGLYNISDINNYLQFDMIAAKWYYITSTGSYVYFAEIIVNPTRYAVQINTYATGTALPAGATYPSGGFGGNVAFTLPTVNADASVTILATNDFYKIIGFSPPTYTLPYTTPTALIQTQSFLSSVAPQVSPNPSVLVAITNIDNKYANPTSIIYSITPSVGIGSLIIEKPPEFNYNKLLSGSYNRIRLQLLGSSSLAPIQNADPNICIMLVIKDESEDILDKFRR